MNATPGIRMSIPAHLGEFVKHEIIEPYGLSVTDAACVLGVSNSQPSSLIRHGRLKEGETAHAKFKDVKLVTEPLIEAAAPYALRLQSPGNWTSNTPARGCVIKPLLNGPALG